MPFHLLKESVMELSLPEMCVTSNAMPDIAQKNTELFQK